jgi:NAD(P)-dependent dehydrogenase (short-subunit alcohol dehydrogenase family)
VRKKHAAKEDTMALIVVTGASRGLGQETVRRLVEAGHDVWASARDARAEAAATAAGARFVQLDVTDDRSVDGAASRIEEEAGRVDVLVNNAGVPEPANGLEMTVEEMRALYEVNVFGVARVVGAFRRLLDRSPAPMILNVSSESGSFASNLDPHDVRSGLKSLAYAPSKSALNMLTLHYSRVLPGYRVNAIAPGSTRTDFNGNTGVQTVREGTDAVVATVELGPDAPSGMFISRHGPIPW